MKRFVSICGLILSLLFSAAFNSHAAASWVDTNFVSSPLVYRSPPNFVIQPGGISSILPTPDGRIYISGYFTNIQGKTRANFARLLANGALDESFDPPFFYNKPDLSFRMFLEPSGTLLFQVAYGTGPVTGTNLFIRMTDTGAMTVYTNSGVYIPLAIQPDGKILVAKQASFYWPANRSFSASVHRLNQDLSVDSSFITANYNVSHPFMADLTAAVQADGRVLVWGSATSFSQPGIPGLFSYPGLVRFLTNGTRDTSLDGLQSQYSSGLILPDRKILSRVVRGGLFSSAATAGLVLMTEYGMKVPSFGNGVAIPNTDDFSQLVYSADGFIYESRPVPIRFTSEGLVDSTFNPLFGMTNQVYPNVDARTIATLPDGSILVGGVFNRVDGLPFEGLVRLRDPNVPTNALIEFISSTNYFSESIQEYPVILKRTGNTNLQVVATISRAGGSAGPGDFGFQNSVTFKPGEITNAITVTFPYDGIAGNDRNVLLSLDTVTPGAGIGTRSNQFIHLFDRETALESADGAETILVEGSQLYLDQILKAPPGSTASGEYSANFTALGNNGTNDFPLTNQTGQFSLPGTSSLLGNADNRLVDQDRSVRIDLQISAPSGAQDIRMHVTNISRVVKIVDNDSSAGLGSGSSGRTAIAYPLAGGGFGLVSEFRNVSFQGSDLVEGVSVSVSGSSFIYAIGAQSDDKVLIGGSVASFQGSTNSHLFRLDQRGSNDTSFAIGSGPNNAVRRVFTYPDGRLLVSGDFTSFSGFPLRAIVRLGPNGTLDPSLNVSNLVASTPESGWLLADGAILVRLPDKSLKRINANGSLDQSFSGSSEFPLSDARLSHGGRILVAQSFGTINGIVVTNVMRLTSAGARDPAFTVGTGPNGTVNAVCPLPDGRCLIGGTFSKFNGESCSNLVLLGLDGTLTKAIPVGRAGPDGVRSIEALSDGSILIAGSFDSVMGIPRRNVARITADGTLLPQTPALLSEPIAAGQRVHLRTEPGMRFQLQSSSDLVNWTTSTSFTATAYSTAITNPPAAPGEARFLRAIANP